MSLFSRFRQATANAVVSVGRGTTPHPMLDSRRAFNVIVTVAVVTIIGSAWLVGHDIRLATRPPKQKNTNTSSIAALNALAKKDTDGDGLSDYDELYVYHTSPYLKDSDGDGIPDNVEIQRGTDPNCPQGNVCSSFSLLTSPVDQNGNLTPAFLRQALKAAGVPQAQLDKTDDATLLKIYRDVLAQNPSLAANQNTNQSPTTANTNTTTSLNQLNNLSAAQIRQLLIQSGVDQNTLKSVDDATLMQIFQQATQSTP